MRARACLSAVLPLALLVGACSSGDGDGGGSGSGGVGGSAGGLDTIAGALRSLPETGEPEETIVWGDLERAAEIAGVDRPSDPSDADEAVSYVQSVTGGVTSGSDRSAVAVVPPEVAHADRVGELQAFAADVGWSILDVDRFVERQTPPGVVSVLEGSFDEDDMSEALGAPQEGVWIAGTGEDFAQDFDDISPARPIGESLWLAPDGDYLTIARSARHSDAVRRALGGSEDTPTFSQDEALAGLAEALDGESAYAAMLTRPGPAGGQPGLATPSQGASASACGLPSPTAAVATGIADDDGPVILVALAHESPDAASANAEAIETIVGSGTSQTGQPMSELVTVDEVSTPGDDLVVLARLRPVEDGRALLWYQMMMQREPLISSC